MSPIAHFFGSWLIASATTNNSRDRALVTLAGVLPDADGLGAVVDVVGSLISGQENTFWYYQRYHHSLLHGWPGALLVTLILTSFARQRGRVALLCLLTFHLHLLCDFIGSRGPSPMDLWPIHYGAPLLRKPNFEWHGQWKLDGWQNQIICVGLFATELWLAPRRGFSFASLFSRKADAAFVSTLRKWQQGLLGRRLKSGDVNEKA